MNLTSKYHLICVPVRTLLFLIIFLTPDKYMNAWLILAILSLIVVSYRYLTYSKDQIEFYFIPTEMLISNDKMKQRIIEIRETTYKKY